MKNKINLSGITIGAAALIVGFTGNVQAIPTTQHDFIASHPIRALGQSKQNPGVAALTTSVSSKSGKVKQAHLHQKPSARNLNFPISGGSKPIFGQGAYPLNDLHAPLLPASPVNLPPAPKPVVTGGAAPAGNAIAVPDGGATAALMAGSFGGLALLRKKLKA